MRRTTTAGEDIAAYEGLVIKTAQMFAELVGLEIDDMKQELRLKVVKALRAYDSERSKQTERAFVYSCVANLVKDFKRDAARRSGRLDFTYIDGFGLAGVADLFEFRHTCASHDEIFGMVEEGTFVMPATVTSREEEIIYLLVIGYTGTEIADRLDVDYAIVENTMRMLRRKLADWRPMKPEPRVIPTPLPLAAQPQAVAA
jgi:DNA-directed RNA polymerase specialized sigma24 family protein